MNNEKRLFIPGVLNHCYQNTPNGALIFYSVRDYLVLLSIIYIASKRYDVVLLAVCFMPDHLHSSSVAESLEEFSGFYGFVTSTFAREMNKEYGFRGPVFNAPFGSVPKIGDKKVRTNLIYVYNNPVERRLTAEAEQYRWNFLAYAHNANPFSEPVVLRHASSRLRYALKMVDARRAEGKYLTHTLLRNLADPLDGREVRQLTDYIITKYSVIRHDEAEKYFGTYEKMLTAIHSTTGSEYDINEVFSGRRDDVYDKITHILLHSGRFCSIRDVLQLPEERRKVLANSLYGMTEATYGQILKYLHLPLATDRR